MIDLFTIDAGTLRQALKRLKIKENKSVYIFKCIDVVCDLKHVTMTTYELIDDITTTVTLDTDQIHAAGRCAVNYFDLVKVADVMPGGSVVFGVESIDDIPAQGRLYGGTVRVGLAFQNPADFPNRAPDFSRGSVFNQPVSFLGKLATARCCVGVDNSRRALTGVLFEINGNTTQMVSTDGKEMLILDGENILFPCGCSYIIPVTAIKAMERAFSGKFSADDDFEIAVCEQSWCVSRGAVTVSFASIPDRFPDYDACIPGTLADPVRIHSTELAALLKTLSAASSYYAEFHVENGLLSGTAQNTESGLSIAAQAALKQDQAGELPQGKFCIDVDRLKHALLTGGDRLEIHFNKPSLPVVVSGDSGRFIIMPLRRNKDGSDIAG